MENKVNRRKFISTTAAGAAGVLFSGVPAMASTQKKSSPQTKKKRVALVGTGSRGTGFWGRKVIQDYSDLVEYVGLCDLNQGRLEAARKYMGAQSNASFRFVGLVDRFGARRSFRLWFA
jgi:hypothetical protein